MAYARQRYGAVTRYGGARRLTSATDCVCDSGHEWCCTAKTHGRLVESRRRMFPMNTARSFGDYFSIGGIDDDAVGVRINDRELSLRDSLSGPNVKTAAAVALTYHGYKRTGSILWALLYGSLGRTVPLVAVPIALAQGFGKQKVGC